MYLTGYTHYRTFFFTCVLLAVGWKALAQKVYSEEELTQLALQNSGLMQAADWGVKQNKALQKSAFNLPSPEVIAESPTGEFYAVGVLQSIDFPTVYVKQNQLQKQLTKLAEKQKSITEQDVKKLIKTLYLNLQYTLSSQNLLKIQDSLYQQVKQAAQRQFEAGQIDFLEKTFSEAQYGEVHNQFVQSGYDLAAIQRQLQLYTGLTTEVIPAAFTKVQMAAEVSQSYFDTTHVTLNPTYQYSQQLTQISKKSLALEKNKALPGLVFGYLNQGARETDTYYRFRVGFTVPLWFWQYSGNVKAAKYNWQATQQLQKAQQQSVSAELQQAYSDIQKFSEALTYYETSGVQQARSVITTAERFFQTGETDYINFLRNTNEAYQIQARYLETLRNYNQSIITLHYLTGQL